MKYEASLADHQNYQTVMSDWSDWLRSVRDRIDVCSDRTGDIHAVQNQLDRLEVMVCFASEGVLICLFVILRSITFMFTRRVNEYSHYSVVKFNYN